jgi:ribosome recycling factor
METGDSVLKKLQEHCAASVTAFKRDLQKVRTGRASSGLLENIQVDYYGAKTQLTHLAQISTPEARTIVVQVYDTSAVQAVEKAIKTSDLGFNPQREGNTLRVSIPQLTAEVRKEIIKHLNKMTEEMRISVRNHRRDANDILKKLEKDGDVTKDDAKRLVEKVQKQVDATIAEIDKLLVGKEAEISEV